MKRHVLSSAAVILAISLLISGCSSNSVKSDAENTENSDATVMEYDITEEHGSRILENNENIVGGVYVATETDESVFAASGSVKATITGSLINKESGSASSADDSSFKGVNSAVRVYGNAEVTIKECTIEASAKNATGVFAYDGGTVCISDSTVSVTGGGAGGIQVAGGGTLIGENLTVTSASKAAIRSDRGGGTIIINGGKYTSTGTDGCPAIYSTADITVKNAECISERSRAVIIEGKNSVTLENCILSGNDQSSKTGSIRANVLLYQSASGDAAEGTSVFTMNGGTMTSGSGAMFYCTNTRSIINLSDAELLLSQDGSLLIVSAGRWGNEGKNGGKCTLSADNQQLSGTVYVDSVSELTINLTDSTFTGSISNEGTATVNIDATSKWILTADSYVTSLKGDLSRIELNGHKLYVNGKTFE